MFIVKHLAEHRFNHVDMAGMALFWLYIRTDFWFAWCMLGIGFVVSTTLEIMAKMHKQPK